MLEKLDQWLEAPQIVLDGTELLILIALFLIATFVRFKCIKKGD